MPTKINPVKPVEKRNPLILVVEKRRQVDRIIGDLLAVMGCETRIVYDVRAAFQLSKMLAPDVIFAELDFSGAFDETCFIELFRGDPSTFHIPLVAISKFGNTAQKQFVLDAGFNSTLEKPVRFSDLQCTLSNYGFIPNG